MAFTRVDQWDVRDRNSPGAGQFALNQSIMATIVYFVSGTHLRIIASSLATIAVHVLLIIFLLYRISDVQIAPGSKGAGVMTLIDLSNNEAQQPKSETKKVEEAAAASPATPSVQDPITTTDAPEWAVVKMRVAQATQPAATIPAAPASASTSTAASSSASGGGGWDPYAGSAPQWRQLPAAQSVSSPQIKLVELDAKVVERIRAMLGRQKALGSQQMRLRFGIDPSGKIISVIASPGTPSDMSIGKITMLLRGKSLACFTAIQNCTAILEPGSTVEAII